MSEKLISDAAIPPDLYAATAATASPGVTPALSSPVPRQFGFGVSIAPTPQPGDALLQKLTDNHLSKVIAQTESENARKHRERILSIIIIAVMIVFAGIFILVLCYMFLSFQKPELLQPLITLILGFIGGMMSGIGLGRYTAQKNEPEK